MHAYLRAMRIAIIGITLLLPALLLAQEQTKQERKVRGQLARGKAYPAIRNATAMLIKGGHPEFFALRAQAYNSIGEHAKAEADARNGLKALPGNAEGLMQLALAEKGEGRLDSSAAHLKQLPGAATNGEVLYQLALVEKAQNRLHEAMATINKAIAVEGDPAAANAKLHRVKGEIAALAGDTALARAELDHAVQLAPADPVNYNSRGYFLHALQGDHKGAIADYDRAIKLNPNYSYAFNNRGWSRYMLGQRDKGIKDILQAKRRRPGNPYIYRNLGVIALQSGDTAKACTLFREALDKGFTALYGGEVEHYVAQSCGTTSPGKPPAPPAPLPPRKDQPAAPRTNAPE